MAIKLNDSQKHLLQLIVRGADVEGWAPVSKGVYPLIETLPTELVVLEPVGGDGSGRVRLTKEGENVLAAMAWL